MKRPILFMTVGLPATGKTTIAKELEHEHDALRLTKDEWIKALYGDENPPDVSDVVEGRLIELGLRALELGNNVVIDFGLWSRNERSSLRQAAADLGAEAVMFYTGLPRHEQQARLTERFAKAPESTWAISERDLDEWAAKMQPPTEGEREGTEPIDEPPAGFATWQQWRADRWPATLSNDAKRTTS